MDALVDFMQKKRNTEKLENGGIPPNIEEMLKAFALRVGNSDSVREDGSSVLC